MKTRVLPALAALFLFVGACGGDGGTSPDDDEGTFTLIATGAISTTVTGAGGFHVAEEDFGIVLIGEDEDDSGLLISGTGGRPGPGTLMIGSAAAGDVSLAGIVANTTIGSAAGTLTISSSSSNRLVGTAEFTGQTHDEGDFSATLTFDLPCTLLQGCG